MKLILAGGLFLALAGTSSAQTGTTQDFGESNPDNLGGGTCACPCGTSRSAPGIAGDLNSQNELPPPRSENNFGILPPPTGTPDNSIGVGSGGGTRR